MNVETTKAPHKNVPIEINHLQIGKYLSKFDYQKLKNKLPQHVDF